MLQPEKNKNHIDSIWWRFFWRTCQNIKNKVQQVKGELLQETEQKHKCIWFSGGGRPFFCLHPILAGKQ